MKWGFHDKENVELDIVKVGNYLCMFYGEIGSDCNISNDAIKGIFILLSNLFQSLYTL